MKLLVCLLSVMVILEGYKIKCCLPDERDGLLQIKSYIISIADSDYGSSLFPTWVAGDERSDCCKWDRVKCSPSTGRVTHLFLSAIVEEGSVENWTLNMTLFHPFQELSTLNLSHNNIKGLLQSEGVVSTLTSLQDLDLSNNYFGLGYLPEFLWRSSSLGVLDLSDCSIHGKLDERVCQLKNIRELYFSFNYLDSLPDCIWNLTSLQVLDLPGNSINGSLPSTINLPYLEWLSIKDNHFRGKFSLSSLTNHSNLKVLLLSNNILQVELGESLSLSTMQLQVLGLANCNISIHTKTLQKILSSQSNLQYIDLHSNSLFGPFPTWLLQNNSDLKLLYLRNNLLTGCLQLPHRRSNLSLVLLDLSSNKFSGEIPQHMGMTLYALEMLRMSDNSFQGQIPYSLGNMTQLEVLDLSNNKLFGKVPNKLFSDCSHLAFLMLSNNNLDGEIIPSNMKLPSLNVMLLGGNHFSGTIKESLKISKGLAYLDVSDNKVTGELPSWIGSLSQLDTMSLARNRFHGDIPSQICNLIYLQYLDLSKNRFTGNLPSCGCPAQLNFLHLEGNRLTGGFPKGLKRCNNLAVLNLASNRLSGGIPRWIHMISRLEMLLMGDNQLQGELPIQLCQFTSLNILDVSNNNISGTIPSCLQNLSFGSSQLDYSVVVNEHDVIVTNFFELFKLRNRYIFEDDEGRSNDIVEKVEFIVKRRSYSYKGKILSMMSVLDLSRNQFTGYIPPELGELSSLNTLNFSHNHLSGPIPESFSKLKGIESLDLSFNKLSGRIPLSLVDLNFLEVFIVSYNNLSGTVPETGQFLSFDESSYRGNPLLCGSQLPKSCTGKEPPPPPSAELEDEGETTFDLEVFFWSFGVTFVIVVLTFFLVLYINADWRRAWFVFIDLHFLWWFY